MHTVTRWFKTAALCMLAAFCFAACEPKDPIEVIQTDYGYSVKVEDIHLAEGVFASLTVSMNDGPAEPVSVSMQYRVDDDPFLVMAKDGEAFQSGGSISLAKGMKVMFTLPALKEGSHVVNLIFTNSFGKSINADVTFNVIRDPILVTDVSVPADLRLLRGESAERDVLVYPETADDLSLEMTVTDAKVVSAVLTGDGARKTLKVEALQTGKSEIVFKHKDVKDPYKVVVEVYDYVITPLPDLTMTEGDEETVSVTVTPQAEAVMVSSNGHVSVAPAGVNTFRLRAESSGTAVLKATAGGVSESFTVKVEKKPETISLSPRSATLSQGVEKTFSVYCSSAWSVDLTSDLVEVTEHGNDYIILKNDNQSFDDGKVTLTVTCDADPEVKAAAEVKVEGRKEDISLMVTTENEGKAFLEVAGENDGWDLVSYPDGSKASVSGRTITLSNGTYSDITGFVVVRTKKQGVEASQEVTVPGLVAKIESVSLSETSFSIEEGQSFTLSASARWSDGREEDITGVAAWSASSNIAVNGNRFTAVTPGDAWVKMSYGEKEASIKGTVTAKPIFLSGLTISPSTFSVEVNKSQTFTAEASYTDGSFKDISSSAKWKCDGGKATAAAGTFLFEEVGKASVTVTFAEGGKEFSATSEGEVTPKPATVEYVTISPSSVDCTEGDEFKLDAYAKWSDKSVTWNDGVWSVKDSDILLNLGEGRFKAISHGSTNVYYEKGGEKASASVYVREFIPEPDPEPVSLTISNVPQKILEGDSFQLKCIATMSRGAADKDVTAEVQWSSSLPSCAVVSASGYVTAKACGNTWITATLGSLKAEISLAVYEPEPTLLSISMDNTKLSLAPKKKASLKVTGLYSNGSSRDVTSRCSWTSSNTAVATVSSGTVTAVKEGSATISASLEGKTATCSVSVEGQQVIDITIAIKDNSTGGYVNVTQNTVLTHKKTYTLSGTVKTVNPTASYPITVCDVTCSDSSKVKLTQSGISFKMEALSIGTATLRFYNSASMSDPGLTKEITIRVQP